METSTVPFAGHAGGDYIPAGSACDQRILWHECCCVKYEACFAFVDAGKEVGTILGRTTS
jgi:hypothetical protein